MKGTESSLNRFRFKLRVSVHMHDKWNWHWNILVWRMFCLKFTDQTKCDKFFVKYKFIFNWTVMRISVVCSANGVNQHNRYIQMMNQCLTIVFGIVHMFTPLNSRIHVIIVSNRIGHSIIYTSVDRLKRIQTIDSIAFIISVNYHFIKEKRLSPLPLLSRNNCWLTMC